MSRVGSGRVNRCSRLMGRVGSGHPVPIRPARRRPTREKPRKIELVGLGLTGCDGYMTAMYRLGGEISETTDFSLGGHLTKKTKTQNSANHLKVQPVMHYKVSLRELHYNTFNRNAL